MTRAIATNTWRSVASPGRCLRVNCPVLNGSLRSLGERGKCALKDELVVGADARVVEVDAKETIGSGSRENLSDDGIVVACRQRPNGSGALELEICSPPEGVGCGLHSGECEINRVVGAG